MHTFTLEYWQDGGWFVGRLRENPSVMTQGETLAELQENVRDAYELMMEAAPSNNRPRQTLNWMKPSEVFGQAVASIGEDERCSADKECAK